MSDLHVLGEGERAGTVHNVYQVSYSEGWPRLGDLHVLGEGGALAGVERRQEAGPGGLAVGRLPHKPSAAVIRTGHPKTISRRETAAQAAALGRLYLPTPPRRSILH